MTSLATCRRFWLKSDLSVLSPLVSSSLRKSLSYYADFRYRYRAGLNNILVLLIGGIPIALPTVLSVTLAVGAQQLAKYKAIVTRITAIEELAGVTIPCSELWSPASSPSTATLSKHFLPLTPRVRRIRTPSTCPPLRHSEIHVFVPESNCSTSSRSTPSISVP